MMDKKDNLCFATLLPWNLHNAPRGQVRRICLNHQTVDRNYGEKGGQLSSASLRTLITDPASTGIELVITSSEGTSAGEEF
jgi:hypothetical protein